MSHYRQRILCGYLLAAAFGPCWALAQSEPALKITPNQETVPNESKPDANATFAPLPVAPVVKSISVVPRLLAENSNYKSGDLLTWETVKPTLDRLRRSKIPLPPEKELRAKFLSQNDPLVKMLGTRNGKAFFQELKKKPSSIDLVDRYRVLPRGEHFLGQMINDTGGYEFFTKPYWLTPRDAIFAEQGELTKVSNGSKFGESTGRIYVESQLVAFLSSYKASGTSRSYE